MIFRPKKEESDKQLEASSDLERWKMVSLSATGSDVTGSRAIDSGLAERNPEDVSLETGQVRQGDLFSGQLTSPPSREEFRVASENRSAENGAAESRREEKPVGRLAEILKRAKQQRSEKDEKPLEWESPILEVTSSESVSAPAPEPVRVSPSNNPVSINSMPTNPVHSNSGTHASHAAPTYSSSGVGELPRSEARVLAADTKLDVESDLKRRFGSNVKSALGAGTVIEGKFSFDSPVRIDGTLTGEISSSSVLIVGKQATVSGNIKVGSLIILGQVEANIEADELVEIRSEGKLIGDIKASRLAIEDGGFFEGRNTPRG